MATSYRFGGFDLQPSERRLLADREPVVLGARAFDVLVALVERAGQLVSKEELLERVWPRLVVEEANLQVQISTLRKVIGAEAIATVAGKGYRFTREVKRFTMQSCSPPGDQRHNLPQQVTSFIGRDRESAELKQLLVKTRLLTLIAAGGVGKTRQALQVAADVVKDYADGAWFVDLAPIADAQLVPATIADTLGVDLGNTQSPAEALIRRLRSVDLLLLLDNCEHVIAASAGFVEALLAGTRKVRVLATSREPLAIAGEQVFRLPSLALPMDDPLPAEEVLATAAVALFVDRAKGGDAHFAIDNHNVNAIAAICRRLDGIPLAIEMAAARSSALGIEEVEQRLDERFRLLTGGRRTAVPRHQTLRATFDWSHALLSEPERIVFRRLAIFRGGFTLEAASAVASDEAIDEFAVIDMLAHLVSCSLVVADSTTAGTRYGLLETTRAYALEQLTAAGETDMLARSHARYLCKRFECAIEDRWRMSDADWEPTYLPERDNVRAALDWAFGPRGDAELGIVLASAAGDIWFELSYRKEGQHRLDTAISRIGAGTPERSQARLWYCLTLIIETSPLQAIAGYERAIDLFRRAGELRGCGYALLNLGFTLAKIGRFDEAKVKVAEAYPFLEPAGMPRLLAKYFLFSGAVKGMAGDLASAWEETEHALSLYRAAGAQRGTMNALGNLAEISLELGDLDAAQARLDECVSQARKASSFNQGPSLAGALGLLAGILTERGQLDEALLVGREALLLFKEAGSSYMLFDTLALRAGLVGRLVNAARLQGHSDSYFASRGVPRANTHVRIRERLHVLLNEKLGPDELARLLAEGSRLSEDEACRIALEE